MSITNGSFVCIHFDMLAEDGSVLASTRESEPLEYVHGLMQLDPPGLSPALEGANIGDSLTIELSPEQAYGPKLDDQNSVDVIPLNSFPEDLNVGAGLMFEALLGDKSVLCTVLGVDGDQVQIYYGHPLAGQTLTFNVDVIDVRVATEEDIQHLETLHGSPEQT